MNVWHIPKMIFLLIHFSLSALATTNTAVYKIDTITPEHSSAANATLPMLIESKHQVPNTLDIKLKGRIKMKARSKDVALVGSNLESMIAEIKNQYCNKTISMTGSYSLIRSSFQDIAQSNSFESTVPVTQINLNGHVINTNKLVTLNKLVYCEKL